MLITAAILAILVYGMIAAMLGTILPDISQRFSLSPKQNGNIATFQALGLTVGAFFVGPLMDLQGKRIGMLIALALIAIALLMLRAASGYQSVVTAMLVLGLGGGMLVTAANSLNADIDPARPAVVSNWLNLFFGLGGLITPLISARLFRKNARGLVLFAAILAVLALGASVVAPFRAPSGTVSFQFSEVATLLTDIRLLVLALILFLYISCEVGIWNWLVRHLVAQGVPESKALTILSLGFALGLLLGRIGAAQILQQVDARTVLIGAAALMSVTTYVMLQSSSPGVAQALVFITGLAAAPVFPTTLGVVGTLFTGASAATALGIASAAGWLGLVASSPIIGGIAGADPRKLKKALLLIPAASVVMLAVSFAI
jgi:fucose permease